MKEQNEKLLDSCQRHTALQYPPGSHRHKEITDAVTFMIAKDMFPFNTVSDPGFNKLINTLDKQYVLPSHHHISRTALPALHDERHEKVQVKRQQHYILPPQQTYGRATP